VASPSQDRGQGSRDPLNRATRGQCKQFDEAVDQRIGETFIWLLTPHQDPGSAEVRWEQTRVTGGEPIPVRVSKKLKIEEG
jgi:hypothetical protein